MSYPTGCYNRTRNLRVRPLKEMKSCVVFRPDPPKLFMLNLNAWFILELCDGSTAAQLERNYCSQVAAQLPDGEARDQLKAGLEQLKAQGLIELTQAGELTQPEVKPRGE